LIFRLSLIALAAGRQGLSRIGKAAVVVVTASLSMIGTEKAAGVSRAAAIPPAVLLAAADMAGVVAMVPPVAAGTGEAAEADTAVATVGAVAAEPLLVHRR
jgi:hypothetical protein